MTLRLDDVAARAVAQALDGTLAELEALPTSRERTLALDAIDALLQLYGEGLARVVTAHRDGGGWLPDELFTGDEVVAQLLSIHGLLAPAAPPAELVRLRKRPKTSGQDPNRTEPLAELEDEETQCEMCAAEIAAGHRHLLDRERRRLVCACPACAILFDGAGAGGGRYRLIPRRYVRLDRSMLDGGLWERLELPVDIVFMVVSSAGNDARGGEANTTRPVAFYPGPMGTTESALPLPAWSDVVATHPVLGTLERDVEALLVRRTRGAREYWIVPVDECYRLAGAMRATWQGISGGDATRRTVDAFFGRLAMSEKHGKPANVVEVS